MTAIVTYRSDDGVHVIADKRHNYGYGMYFDNATKGFDIGNLFVLFAGATVIRNAIADAQRNGVFDTIYPMTVSSYLEEVKHVIKDEKTENDDFNMITIVDNECYFINGRLDPIPIPTRYMSIGTGGEYAEGWLAAKLEGNTPMTVEHHMRKAIVEAAKKYSNVSPESDYWFIPRK